MLPSIQLHIEPLVRKPTLCKVRKKAAIKSDSTSVASLQLATDACRWGIKALYSLLAAIACFIMWEVLQGYYPWEPWLFWSGPPAIPRLALCSNSWGHWHSAVEAPGHKGCFPYAVYPEAETIHHGHYPYLSISIYYSLALFSNTAWGATKCPFTAIHQVKLAP